MKNVQRYGYLVLPAVVERTERNVRLYAHTIHSHSLIYVLYLNHLFDDADVQSGTYLCRLSVDSPEEIHALFGRAWRNMSKTLPKVLLPSREVTDSPHVRLFCMSDYYVAQVNLADYSDVPSVNLVCLGIPQLWRQICLLLNHTENDVLYVLYIAPATVLISPKPYKPGTLQYAHTHGQKVHLLTSQDIQRNNTMQ